ncbi:MAG: protein arginine kinase [Clostridia bacterium]|nr:protein arginine kinase [Clostridia bacterium]
MSQWYKEIGNEGDIVVSTRIRIARNIKNTPFPARINREQLKLINEMVKDAVSDINDEKIGKLNVIDMNNVSDEEACAMVERHIISPDFAANRRDKILVLSDDEGISIMVCEEDHIRIQVIKSGLALTEAYEIADAIDNLLSEKVSFAFDEQFGYLTQCPTNLGTGLRASLMLHLPIIEGNGTLASIAESASKFGLTVRGIYGEGTKSAASLYQLSNQITLGISEKSAIDNLKSIAMQIISKEREDRALINKISLEDTVMRAYGTLKFQRILSSEEFMKHISKIKLGCSLGIIDVDAAMPVRLLVECQPYMLQKEFGIMTPDDRDICRAKKVREQLE